MDDLQFEATVAEIRGFDLGDDSQLLAHLDARMAEGLRGEEWLLRGVLLHRAGRYEDAVDSLDQAVDQGHAQSQAHYLKSCVLREHGSMGEALEALEEARMATADDGLLSSADLDHAQGLLFWRVGNREDALYWVEQALEADEHNAERWLHRGRLFAELGRHEDAAHALERALEEEPDLDRAMFERAALEAVRGEADATAQWLSKAIRLEPEHRRLAAEDPRFSALREHAAMGELLASTHPADLQWLDALTPWLAAFREDRRLERLGVEWLSKARSDRISVTLEVDYEDGPLGTMHTAATLERSRALLETRTAVAQGPGSRTREGVLEPSILFIDTARPQDGLWLALSSGYPPFLWLRVAPTIDDLTTVLAEFFPRPRRSRVDMSRQTRGFIGYRSRFVVPSPVTGGLEPATLVELQRHLAINPFVESVCWGSAYAEDPWPDEIPDQPGVVHKIAEHQRMVARQEPGHAWSLTWRTRHSRSYLSIEVHHHDIYVAQLRYRPSVHSEAVETMNTHFGCDYPVDMPVDAVAALLGFQFDGARDLEAQLPTASDPEQLAGLLLVLSALRHEDLGVLELYRRYVDHPATVVRSTVGDIAVAHNHEVLLEEMSVREPDVQLRTEIEALLDEGIPMIEDDPYAASDEDGEVELSEGEVEELTTDDTVELDVADVEVDAGARGGPSS